MPSSVSCRGLNLSEGATASECVASRAQRTRPQEIRVIQQVKEVCVESEGCSLIQLECFTDTEINIGKLWSGNCTAPEIGIAPQVAMSVDCRITQTVC